jgi:hypothetical protein
MKHWGCAVLALVMAGCSARVTGHLNLGTRAAEGLPEAELEIKAGLETEMTALLRSMAGNTAASLIDGLAISRSFTAAPGVAQALLLNVSPSSVEGTVAIASFDSFLAAPALRFKFITVETHADGGNFVVSLDRSLGPEIVRLLSEDAADYLSAVMAPISTGEVLTVGEYLDLVTSVYGAKIAAEIARSRIVLEIDFPGPISAISEGGKKDSSLASKALFDLPLVDLLVLEKPLIHRVAWTMWR